MKTLNPAVARVRCHAYCREMDATVHIAWIFIHYSLRG
jgi:hypothetical protein